MADRFPHENDEADAGESGSDGPESDSGSPPSKRRLKRDRKAADRKRRRLEKAERKRARKAGKLAGKRDGTSEPDEKSEGDEKPKARDERSRGRDEKPKRGEKPEGRARRPRGKRRGRLRGRERSSSGSAAPRKRRGARARLAAALPGRGKRDGSKDAKASRDSKDSKPKRAKGERRPPGTLERAFTQVLAILGAVIAGVVGVLAVVVRAIAKPAARVGRRIGAWITAVSRLLTPTRGLLLAAIGCAILLGLSQFVDYRGISIGADAYAPGIQTVAPAPEVERAELGSAHGYAMIPVAAIAIVVLLVAVRTRRWQLCRLVVALGIAAIAVALLIDRPAGLDEGNLNQDFTGVEAKLLGGYWMEIFAGIGLAVTSLLLGGEIKRAAPARARREAPKSPEDSEEPEPGGKRGRRRRRSGRRRSAGAEGAGA